MNPIIYGHRGVPTKAPENSLKGFELILQNKIPGVELDIHLTKDNKLVVIHDFNSKKMTGVNLEIRDSDYHELKNLDIGEGENIPLLDDVFSLLGNRVLYDLEVKSTRHHKRDYRKNLIKELIILLLKHNLKENLFISSFDPLILIEFNRQKKRAQLDNIETGIIYSKDEDVHPLLRTGIGAFFTKTQIIKPHYSQLKGFIYFVLTKILKKRVATWTVNDEVILKEAIKNGAQGICTNHPIEFLKLQGTNNLSNL